MFLYVRTLADGLRRHFFLNHILADGISKDQLGNRRKFRSENLLYLEHPLIPRRRPGLLTLSTYKRAAKLLVTPSIFLLSQLNVVVCDDYLIRCRALHVPQPTYLSSTSPSMTFSGLLTGKTVCITGASRGIGRATALEACQHGASGLLLHYFGDPETIREMQSLKDELRNLNEECKVVSVPGDIANLQTSLKVGAQRTAESHILTSNWLRSLKKVSQTLPELVSRT